MENIAEVEIVSCSSSQYLRPFRVLYSQDGTKKSWDCMRTHDSVAILIFNTTRRCFVVVKQFRPAVYMCEMERYDPQIFQEKDRNVASHPQCLLPAAVGVTYELCAGIIDHPELSLEEIACKEILEECGYDVPTANLKRISSYRFPSEEEEVDEEWRHLESDSICAVEVKVVSLEEWKQAVVGDVVLQEVIRSGVGISGSKQTMFYAEVTDSMKTEKGGGTLEEGELIEVVEIPLQDATSFSYNEDFPKTMGVLFGFMWFQNNVAPLLQKK